MSEQIARGTSAFPANTLIVSVPEPGEPDWSGTWDVWLGRNLTDHWTKVAEAMPSFDEAKALADRMAEVIYPGGGSKAVRE